MKDNQYGVSGVLNGSTGCIATITPYIGDKTDNGNTFYMLFSLNITLDCGKNVKLVSTMDPTCARSYEKTFAFYKEPDVVENSSDVLFIFIYDLEKKTL
jgi:hypothetical protein